jgi:hypothetical protein
MTALASCRSLVVDGRGRWHHPGLSSVYPSRRWKECGVRYRDDDGKWGFSDGSSYDGEGVCTSQLEMLNNASM